MGPLVPGTLSLAKESQRVHAQRDNIGDSGQPMSLLADAADSEGFREQGRRSVLAASRWHSRTIEGSLTAD
jgi:hypothetical protein